MSFGARASAQAGAPLLEVRGLTTAFSSPRGSLTVVEGVDLALVSGETLALLGESGCGKSLTALSLMRLLPPNARVLAGSARFDGVDLLALPESRMRALRGGRMAMIFQEPQSSLNPVLSVGRQIAEALRTHQGGASRTRVLELLEAVGIPEPQRRIDEYPHQLSGGMKQRVMIAMALAGEPRLLIADEPTTALDVTIQAQVLALLKDLQRRTGLALLLITHDLGVVAQTAERLAVMYGGQIVETAAVADFFAAPAHPYSRALLASLPDVARREVRLAAISGRVPAPGAALPGCHFAARCPAVLPCCHHQPPSWYELASGQQVRCHLYASGPGERSARPWMGQGGSVCEVPQPVTDTPDAAAPALLAVEDLAVHFPIRRGLLRRTVGQVRAVDGVSLQLHAGRTLALVGESGCGKTTVGKGILQLLRPNRGRVLYGGRDLCTLDRRQLRVLRADLQIVFQDPYAAMNPRLPVGEIVAEGLDAHGRVGDGAERAHRVAGLLELVGLEADAATRYPHAFSGGQRQRICIARALALEPRVLVCDEPTSALDVSVQAQILNLLKDLQRRFGLSYLFITHDLTVVAYLADEVAVMYRGRIVECGTVTDVLDQPCHDYTRTLLAAVPRIETSPR